MENQLDNHKPKVLVIHALRPTSRQTTIDHLLSFREHLPHADVQYLHFQQPLPKDLGEVSPDLMIVNYDFLNYRFSPLWPFIKRRHKDIADRAGKVVAIAQDDFWANKLLDDWCMDWDVDRILTPIDNDRDVLYPKSIKSKEFRTGLTGYVKSGPVPVTKLLADRSIDLGQRVRDMPPHLGRLAQAKARQAVVMADAARAAGFIVDVSTRVEDSFIGTAWFDFLSSCKFTVGMKGGASLHDPRGLIHTKVQSYRVRHPDATFDEIEQHCFKGKDMKHEFTAISPRLFESAMAGTCQILQREDYLGVLEPWRDYIPLEADYSNMDEVLLAMKDLDKCQLIVENAKKALVESKFFDYSQLVKAATDGLLRSTNQVDSSAWGELSEFLSKAASTASKVSVELHDSSLYVIQEEILNWSESQFEKFVHFLERRQLSKVAEEFQASVSFMHVLDALESAVCLDWLVDLAISARGDSMSLRTAWIWRPITPEEESSI
jgi:hypothetical protein